jgi:Transposase DDE domain
VIRPWARVPETQEIIAVDLTADDVGGGVSALPDLLDQIEDPVSAVTADGVYDGGPIYDEVLQRHSGARVIIPPRATAVLSEAGTTQRGDHLRSIKTHGRIGWQRRSGYGRRSLVATAMYRYKTIIGRRHARTLPNQRTEAKIACNALNKMTHLGMPISVRIE